MKNSGSSLPGLAPAFVEVWIDNDGPGLATRTGPGLVSVTRPGTDARARPCLVGYVLSRQAIGAVQFHTNFTDFLAKASA